MDVEVQSEETIILENKPAAEIDNEGWKLEDPERAAALESRKEELETRITLLQGLID